MKGKRQKAKGKSRTKDLKLFLKFFTFYFLVFTFIGCEAFVRKFTRKPKKDDLAKEEMVLAPEEYKGPQMTKEELYRQYLLYWKSWQDELIAALSPNANHKKQIGCANEALKNLSHLRTLLNTEKQKRLDIYIAQLENLKGEITKDAYSSSVVSSRLTAERIRRNILKEFSYQSVKDYLG